ncbi:molybdenum cofactor guanylyltransferase MobA [Thiocystis violacea]|uniref:molybdenum cofactor guanylyltransferase MobA n=1 Tax=Thiocystis violacea TaxID=13725 RepID=UPI00190642A7|nr:molybdenum cofactor guanylyltransferase MobA [Thiocystis violacea]
MSDGPPNRDAITGLILAGGQARRMGGEDKGLRPFAGRPLVEWCIEALAPQVGTLLISANRNIERYAAYGYPVIADSMAGFQGPLAGLLAGLRAARTPWILTLPCDAPRPPLDLAQRLVQALVERNADLAVATDGERRQSLHALLPVSFADDLERFLASGERKVEHWQTRHRIALADFRDCPERFGNINSPDEARRLEHVWPANTDPESPPSAPRIT